MASDAPHSVAKNEVSSDELVFSDGIEEHAPIEDSKITVASDRLENQLQTDAATKGKDPDEERHYNTKV